MCFSGWLVWHKVGQPSDVKVERDRWDWGGKESWSWTISDAYSRENSKLENGDFFSEWIRY